MTEAAAGECFIEARELTREYRRKVELIHAVHEVSFTIGRGEHVVLFGPSGSGKTTLLQLLAGLDLPTHGAVLLRGRDLASFSEKELSIWRSREVGFVFQDFGVIRSLSALDNVRLPLILSPDGEGGASARATLERLGLADRLHHFPQQLSRGEQQRVAIARALIHSPSLLLADEPTASLDSASSAEVVGIFEELRAERNLTVIVATHDSSWIERADRCLYLDKGRLTRAGAA